MVDDLTGKKLGRASSGTFRTADVVGLDTMAHVIKTLQDNLRPTDPFYASYATPAVLAKLIDAGRAGPEDRRRLLQEGRQGHPAPRPRQAATTWPAGGKADAIVERMLKKPAAERLKLLRESSNPQAQFLWAILRDSFHYAAVHLDDIADSARDVDFAMRWGFGIKQGPFELWQEAGWQQVARVGQGRHRRRQGAVQGAAAGLGVRRAATRRAHAPKARGARRSKAYVPRSDAAGVPAPALPRERARRGRRRRRCKTGTEVFKNDDVRVWTLDGEVLIASITAKLHLISPAVIEGLLKAVEMAEAKLQGPGDLVARRRVLGRRQPRADAGLHEDGAKGIAPGGRLQDTTALAPCANGSNDARQRARRKLRKKKKKKKKKLIASIKTKVHAIGPGVIEGLLQGHRAGRGRLQGPGHLVGRRRRSPPAPTCRPCCPPFMKGGAKGIAPEVKKLQDAMLRMRYANVPVVAAVRGMALGGGCEIAVHCAQRVARDGKLRRPGGSGRGPDARRRRPGLHRAPRGRDGGGRQCQRRPAAVRHATASPPPRWPRWAPARSKSRKLGYLLDERRDRAAQGRAAVRGHRAGQGDVRQPATARRRKRLFPVAGRNGHRHHQGPAGQHARRRLHQRARLPHQQR